MASRMHLYARQTDVVDQVTGIKQTFSSWDNCMAKSYCKWPVIATIVVVSLIVISIVWCCARCLCCGLECCCGCLSCCNACCPSPRGGRKRGHQNLEPPPRPYGAPGDQYASHGMPTYNSSVQPSGPQFAHFEVAKPLSKKDEDKLPAMPSWETAVSKKVEVEETPGKGETLEMDDLKKNTNEQVPMLSQTSRHNSPAPSPNPYPAGQHRSPTPSRSPYGPNNDAQGYFAGPGAPGMQAGRSPTRSPGPQAFPGGYRGTGSPAPGPRPYGDYRGPPPLGQEVGVYGPPPGARGSPSPRPGPRVSPGPYGADPMHGPNGYGPDGYGADGYAPPRSSPGYGPPHAHYDQPGPEPYGYQNNQGYNQPRPQDRGYDHDRQPHDQAYGQDYAYGHEQQSFRHELDGGQNYPPQQPLSPPGGQQRQRPPPQNVPYNGPGMGGPPPGGAWRDV